MNNKKILKLVLFCLALLLLFVIVGASDSFEVLRWNVLVVSLLLVAVCFSSRRYYWGTVFIIFAALFNPWLSPQLSKIEWVFLDILLFASLVFWYLDYFRNYHKGLLFERFVENKFPEPTYVLVSATKDLHKKLKRFVEADTNPDLVFRERLTGRTFAVECKYHSHYINGNRGDEGVWWKNSQGERYLDYAQKNDIPVYIAIGIGGNPKSPKITALIPLEVIQKQYFRFIPKKIIEQYQRTPTNF